eukprot:1550865-Rhodomonas_salina.4
MSGTDVGDATYFPTRRPVLTLCMLLQIASELGSWRQKRELCDVWKAWYNYRSPYTSKSNTRNRNFIQFVPGMRMCHETPGTDVGYATTRRWLVQDAEVVYRDEWERGGVVSTKNRYVPTNTLCDARYCPLYGASCLRTPCAMCGTVLAYSASCLRTVRAAATRLQRGTSPAATTSTRYPPTRVLRDVRY